MFQVNDLVKVNENADTVPEVLREFLSGRVGKITAVSKFYPNVSVQFGYNAPDRQYAFTVDELVSAV
jgi:hypothetical protein